MSALRSDSIVFSQSFSYVCVWKTFSFLESKIGVSRIGYPYMDGWSGPRGRHSQSRLNLRSVWGILTLWGILYQKNYLGHAQKKIPRKKLPRTWGMIICTRSRRRVALNYHLLTHVSFLFVPRSLVFWFYFPNQSTCSFISNGNLNSQWNT